MQLLEEVYPGLLDASRPQKVEVFVPLNYMTGSTELSSPRAHLSSPQAHLSSPQAQLLSPAEDQEDIALSAEKAEDHDSPFVTASKSPASSSPSPHLHSVATPPNGVTSSSSSSNTVPLSRRGTTSSASGTTPPSVLQRSGTAPSALRLATSSSAGCSSSTSPSILGLSETAPFQGQGSGVFRKISDASPSSITSSRVAKLSDHSWEMVSKYSNTSNRLSIQQDQCDPEYSLVPLWECLQVSPSPPCLPFPPSSLTSGGIQDPSGTCRQQ